MEVIVKFLPYIPYVVIALLALLVLAFCVYVAIRNFVKKAKNANTVKEVLQAGEEMKEELADILYNETLLTIKEYARELIYSKENLYNSVTTAKTGALKLDSVLTSVESKCYQLNFTFDREFWTKYISSEVSKMKGVH